MGYSRRFVDVTMPGKETPDGYEADWSLRVQIADRTAGPDGPIRFFRFTVSFIMRDSDLTEMTEAEAVAAGADIQYARACLRAVANGTALPDYTEWSLTGSQ